MCEVETYEFNFAATCKCLSDYRTALTTLAKHHAISYAFVKENGGPDEFFNRFPNLNFEAFNQDILKVMLEPLIENGIKTNIKLLEVVSSYRMQFFRLRDENETAILFYYF